MVLEERLQGRSVERKLVAIADSLQNSATQQAVVFVLDEYDLFALRAKQTLLYNLYDMSHAKLRVCVLGVSTKFVSQPNERPNAHGLHCCCCCCYYCCCCCCPELFRASGKARAVARRCHATAAV